LRYQVKGQFGYLGLIATNNNNNAKVMIFGTVNRIVQPTESCLDSSRDIGFRLRVPLSATYAGAFLALF